MRKNGIVNKYEYVKEKITMDNKEKALLCHKEYRNREMLGNTFRKVEAYSQLLSKEIKEPFIRPG